MATSRTKRRFLIIGLAVLVFLVLLFLATCDEGSSSSSSSSSSTQKAQTYKNSEAAVKAGVTFYQGSNHDKAEAAYLEALRMEPGSLMEKNNLGLVYLQQGRNEEALKLYEELIRSVAEESDCWGYYLNYLIAAHANNITARQALTNMPNGQEKLNELAQNAEKQPGKNLKLLLAIYYNAAYMDMELPLNTPASQLFDYSLLQYPADEIEALRKTQGSLWAQPIIDELNTRNKKHFGVNDPDIEEMTSYVRGRASLGTG